MHGVAAPIGRTLRGAIGIDGLRGASLDHDKDVVMVMLVDGCRFAGRKVELPDPNVIIFEQDLGSDGLHLFAHANIFTVRR